MIQARLTFFLILLMTMPTAWAQSTPKYSNEFLNIGVGARAFGMSNSTIVSTTDVTAGYWNPAGLVDQTDKIQLSFMHSAYLAGISNYDYLGIGAKVGEKAAVGFSMIRFGVDGIPNTFDLIQNGQINYDRVTEFSAVDYGFLFSYAQRTDIEGLELGGSAKIIHRRAGEFSQAWGFGVDAAVKYRTAGNWQFAAVVRDVTSTFNAWSYDFTEAEKDIFTVTGNEIPINSLEITLPKLLLGAAKSFAIDKEYSILAEFNMDVNTDGRRNVLIQSDVVSVDPHLGIEADYRKIIFLRAGVGNIQEVENSSAQSEWTMQPNIGLGLNLGRLSVDYALSDIGDQSAALYSHVFSIRAAINPQD